ncbi:phage holin family protein [Mycobacterium sp. 141]|uniref:phage holin family protein n=1 Tax=Mycobacterium sp. 141 TaxID=1120797 RepID=UPI000376CB4B|nr:phage holin family protein [Mycobacterium sp. 141]
MVRFFLRVAVLLGSSAVGLLAADRLVAGVSVPWRGFLLTVVIFTVAQAILSPFIFKITKRYASAFLGGIGLVSTLVALFLATQFTGLAIRGAGAWLAATFVVWLTTAVATIVLPWLAVRIFRKRAGPTAG